MEITFDQRKQGDVFKMEKKPSYRRKANNPRSVSNPKRHHAQYKRSPSEWRVRKKPFYIEDLDKNENTAETKPKSNDRDYSIDRARSRPTSIINQQRLRKLKNKVNIKRLKTSSAKKTTKNQTMEDMLCCICFDKKKDYLLLPCKHLCCCEKCGEGYLEKVGKCPLCQKEAYQGMKIFV